MTVLIDIIGQSLRNQDYRKVLWTGDHTQLVIMNIKPDQETGFETHPDNDQIIVVAGGFGESNIEGDVNEILPGDVVAVPAGKEHNIKNISTIANLSLYTFYSPPHHAPGTVQIDKP